MTATFHYVAAQKIKVGRGLIREKGEHVPEADAFLDPDFWIANGDITRVLGPPPGGLENKPAGAPVPAAAPQAALVSSPPLADEEPPAVESAQPAAEQPQEETPAHQPAPQKSKGKTSKPGKALGKLFGK